MLNPANLSVITIQLCGSRVVVKACADVQHWTCACLAQMSSYYFNFFSDPTQDFLLLLYIIFDLRIYRELQVSRPAPQLRTYGLSLLGCSLSLLKQMLILSPHKASDRNQVTMSSANLGPMPCFLTAVIL